MSATPGPWRIEAGQTGGWAIEVDEPRFMVLCARAPWPEHIEESEANARLIAAAPDLLESLRVLIDEIDRWEEAVVKIVPAFTRAGKWESLESARAIIAKAEGK